MQFTGAIAPFVLLSLQPETQTLRFFGGRHPLCGIGVLSLMVRTSRPAVASARTADSRPGSRTADVHFHASADPDSLALLAAVSDACCAANGVPLRDPRNPSEPELDHAITFPIGSVMVMMVLLNEAWTCTSPVGTTFFSFFLKVFFFAGFCRCFCHGCLVLLPYVFADAFFLFATVPRRGPLRVRALVCVRWPRTGSPRRWRKPR